MIDHTATATDSAWARGGGVVSVWGGSGQVTQHLPDKCVCGVGGDE